MSMGARKLWHFHGGLHLPAYKELSNRTAIRDAPLPRSVILPLRQHIGAPADAQVRVGDRVLKGQRIARAEGYVSAPIHASTSGIVVAIEDRPAPHPSGLSTPCIVIEADGEDRWTESLPEPLADPTALSPIDLRNRIREAGIVGLGGAAFPTAVKLNPPGDGGIHTLVINGAECEPYITCDDRLMREHAREIAGGIAILQHIAKPRETLIGIEDNKPEAIAAMQRAVADAALTHTEVVAIPTIYPTGGEKQLIKVLTGQEVPSHGLPAAIGILCQNVGTAFAVHQAIAKGQPLIERIVTVTGAGVQAPCNLRARIGTPFAELVAVAGGYTERAERLIMGGPLMGFAIGSDEVPIIKGANCIFVAAAEELAASPPALPCIRCGACVEVCPANLLPQQLFWFARSEDFDKIQDHHLFDCIECGCCAHVCPSHIPLVHYYRYAKTEIWKLERDKASADLARDRHQQRLARLERAEREKAERLALKKAPAPRTDASDATDPKQAAIQAALERSQAKKLARAEAASADAPSPSNTTDGD